MRTYAKNAYKVILRHKKENYFVNDLELIVASQECDSDLDSDPKKCMEGPEVFIDWSDLSDHMRKVPKL